MLLFERSTKRVLGLKQQHKDTNKKPAETFDLSAGITVFKQCSRNSAFASTQFFKRSPCSLHLCLLANLMALIFVKYHKHATVSVQHLSFILALVLWADEEQSRWDHIATGVIYLLQNLAHIFQFTVSNSFVVLAILKPAYYMSKYVTLIKMLEVSADSKVKPNNFFQISIYFN